MDSDSVGGGRPAASRFAFDWLRERSRFDAAALSQVLARRFAASLPREARVADLGAGTGSALRLLAPLLRGRFDWALLDADADLLAAAPGAGPLRGHAVRPGERHWRLGLPRASIVVRPRTIDLRRLDERALDGADAVVLFAFLDLVSAEWIDRLALTARRRGLPVLAALAVDGRIGWTPPDPDDPFVHRAFARHQQNDKGFGRAMGPAAAAHLSRRLSRLGYRVAARPSDWRIPPGAEAMLGSFLDGMAQAATEIAPSWVRRIARWRERKRALAAAGSLSLRVGHLDVLGLPRRA